MSQSLAPERARALPVGPRFAAALIDFIILLIPEILAYLLIAAPEVARVQRYFQLHPKQGIAAAVAHAPGYAAANLHFFIVVEAVTAAYLIASYLFLSATVGKRLLGLRITRVDGNPLRVRDAVLRSLPFWVPWLVPAVGLYLNFFQFVGGSVLLVFRPDHRGPEDMLGNSIVVRQEQQGRSLRDLVTIGPPRQPPLAPPAAQAPRGGHLPGWEPIAQPPTVAALPAADRQDPDGGDRPQEEEEHP
ncbi:MAG: RDD family protein [Candidatus Dormibacteria bacterium]